MLAFNYFDMKYLFSFFKRIFKSEHYIEHFSGNNSRLLPFKEFFQRKRQEIGRSEDQINFFFQSCLKIIFNASLILTKPQHLTNSDAKNHHQIFCHNFQLAETNSKEIQKNLHSSLQLKNRQTRKDISKFCGKTITVVLTHTCVYCSLAPIYQRNQLINTFKVIGDVNAKHNPIFLSKKNQI